MRLAALFSNHMVLQRDRAIKVWGFGEPGETVTVELAGKKATATVGSAVEGAGGGRWQVELPALPAGGPHTLTAKGAGPAVTVKEVLIGEVWVCSGQSNMEWPLNMAANAVAETEAALYPQIRLITVPRRTERVPAMDFDGKWEVCTPKTVCTFSAVAYFFGRELWRRLQVPIGLIHTAWGGTPAQAWTSKAGLASDPALKGYLDDLKTIELPPAEAERRNAEQRKAFLAKLPQDQGNRGVKEGWAAAEFDDRGWRTMTIPQYWIGAGHATNGVFWFRRTVEVPAAWAGQAVKLSIGAADKSDDTYVNGVRVGGMTWVENQQSWSTPRNYPVPAGVLKAGKNVIAVRVMSNYTGGGLAGPATLMELHPPAGVNAEALPLAGAWKYEIEQDFGRVTGIAEPPSLMGGHTPTFLFNGMLAPVIPAAIRGAIWYQGESNAADAVRYRALFATMIRDWRKHWGQGDFSFYFVQLANFEHQPLTKVSDDSRWAELREAQAMALKLPHTGMAVAIDIGEQKDIHPKNKQDVGLRLALNALALDYGQKVAYRGPRYKAMKVEGAAVQVTWDAAEGLRARGGTVEGFGVAGADRVFHAATAKIEGGAVVVQSAAVKAPVAVRYGWADCPVCTLENGAGLPAEPFRSDDWVVGVRK